MAEPTRVTPRAGSLFARLKIWQKLAAICLAWGLPLAVLLYLLEIGRASCRERV